MWDTRLERGLLVKDQRLKPITATAIRDIRTGWYRLSSIYRFICEYTGEVLTRDRRPHGLG